METNIKVTPEEVKENMKDVLVRTVVEFGKPCTYVTVRMKNGFTLRESTTCVDPANYNEEIGKEICLERIENKVWFLLGYALQEKAFKELLASKGKEWDEEKKRVVKKVYEPLYGETFYYILASGEVMSEHWGPYILQPDIRRFGNCFKTREEAVSAARKIRALLLDADDEGREK